MKTRKRILGMRRHSMVRPPSKNLWFFSEDGYTSPTRTENKWARNDHISIIQQDFDRYAEEQWSQEKSKKESNFIVDWQMSDTI